MMTWLRTEASSGLAMVAGVILLSLVGYIGFQYVEIADLKRAIEVVKTALATEKKDRAEENERMTRAALTATQSYRELETSKNNTAKALSDDYQTKLNDRDKTIAGLRAERKRLRDQITIYAAPRSSTAASGPGAVCGADERPERLGSLLAESADLLNEGSDLVGALTLQVISLQKYVTTVCTAK